MRNTYFQCIRVSADTTVSAPASATNCYNSRAGFDLESAFFFELTERTIPVKVARTALLLLLTGITVLPAPPSMAQFRGGFPGGGMRGGGGGRDGAADSGRGQRPDPQQNTPVQTEVVMHELHEDLKLTPAQQPAWQSYSDRLQAMVSDLARERTRARAGAQSGPPPNALQQFERTLDAARNRLTALEDIAAAAKTLYDSLTPEQKSIADSRLATIIPNAAGERPVNAPESPGRRRTPP
jgi:protein CpxP